MANTCGDDRFELIAMAREKLINGTNISDRPYEMDALDSILFRCWQMGWLDQLRDGAPMTDTEKAALERRIDELCAEVEALKRDEWAAGFNAGCDAVEAAYEDGKAHYEDENAKLREQVEYMTPIALYAASKHERDRMRELGIEVG
jgi:hypothetical protein